MKDFFIPIIYYLEDLFTSRLPFFPGNIRVGLYIVLFCIIAFSELYIFIFIRRLEQGYTRKRNKAWSDKLTNILANVIVYGDDEETSTIVQHFLPRFERLLGYRTPMRNILVKEILVYHANFTGKTSEILRELYLRLKLDKIAKRHIHDRHWEKQIEAIRELTQMQVRDIAEEILKYTDDENGQLRMEAQAAFVKLSTKDPFRFLDRARERILEWHQLVLFDVITKSADIQIPSFSKWLDSKNGTVVMLCLKLINHYQQLDAIPKLVGLLSHKNLAIRKEVIRVIGKMEAENAEAHLYSIYFDEPVEIRLEILNAMGQIASGNYLDFLQSLSHTDDFKIRMNAMRSIKLHGRYGNEMLDKMYHEETLQNKIIIKHVLDERIKV